MRGAQTATTRGATWLGVAHFAVDAACVTAVLRASPPDDMIGVAAWAFVLGYDLLAFAGQVPVGWLVDRLHARREAALAGLLLAAAALSLGPGGGRATMLTAGVGNALFHVGAGAMVLAGSRGRATPLGLFVAPGALGLGLGIRLGRKMVEVPAWPLLVAVGLGVVIVLAVRDRRAEHEPEEPPVPVLAGVLWLGMVALLGFSVAIRSFVGAVGCDACPKLELVAVGLPITGFVGKLVGGFLADRFGWLDVGVAALLASAPLIAFSGGDPWLVLPGLLVFQMTMPVTLAAVFRLMPRRPGVAFGALCLALVLGILPAYVPGGWHPTGVPVLVLVLASAAALYVALRRIVPVPRAPVSVRADRGMNAS